MCKTVTTVLSFLLFVSIASGQGLAKRIDSLLSIKTEKPFSGVILIDQNGKEKYAKACGYSDRDKREMLSRESQFVIGSISKQFTAVLVLREFDKGHLDLSVPIHKYLPELTQSWADTVTVHHLLTHLHGITHLDKPTSFKVGSQYAYSQIGYDLLAKIVAKTSGVPFAELSNSLFKACGMKHTFHPDVKNYTYLVRGYTEAENGEIKLENASLQNYAAAGSFVSDAKDLSIWNSKFYGGKLLKPETMERLTSKQKGAVRNHPVFGITEYGYGITIDTKDSIVQWGQTGFAPGFVSMNYYFPESKTSVIVLENIAYDTDNLKKTFYYHTAILDIVRSERIKAGVK